MVLEGVFLVMATEVLSLLLSPLILPSAKIYILIHSANYVG